MTSNCHLILFVFLAAGAGGGGTRPLCLYPSRVEDAFGIPSAERASEDRFVKVAAAVAYSCLCHLRRPRERAKEGASDLDATRLPRAEGETPFTYYATTTSGVCGYF